MSMLPIFNATLDNSLSAKQCADVVKQIKKIKGVLSAAFNEESNQKNNKHWSGKINNFNLFSFKIKISNKKYAH